MNVLMSRRFLSTLCVGLIGGFTVTGCTPSGSGTTPPANENDNFTPEGVTFGGVQPPREDVVARPQAINPFAASANMQLPPAADLTRDVPPIGNQGQLGSCTAWASGYAAATYTAQRQFSWGQVSPDHQASPGYLYERLLDTDSFECGSGTLISTAMNLLVQEGCSSLATVAYTDQACSADSPTTDADNFRVGSFNRVVETDLNALRGELAGGSILVFGARLYDDFPNHVGPEVYRGSGTFLTQGNQHAAHAMAVVGYDDERQAFRIMNSWSPEWGDDGFMWMHYDTFKETVFEVYALEPTADRDPIDDGDGPVPGEDPRVFLDDAFQFADVGSPAEGPQVYVVFYFHANQPLFIRTITVTPPTGSAMQAEYNNSFIDGYVHFGQTGGRWPTGTYTLEFDVQIEDGTSNTILILEAEIGDIDGGGDGGGLCSDICIFAFDGECDDGGPSSAFALCDLGTDCNDCGSRESDGGGEQLCSDACRFAGDGECDDGGPDADFAACDFGTDCTDCGPRDRQSGDEFCEDYCPFAFDGECDDGGAESLFAVCDFGSDCDDCGPRSPDDFIDDLSVCSDICVFAFDGECDDGGTGSQFDVCDFGTDCSDCGPRGEDGGTGLCEDSCSFAFDGECDDGGPGADFALCQLGSDCFDCGIRDGSDGGDGLILCDDSCFTSFDGECDDGGTGALFDSCEFGTDCFDCGPRDVGDFKIVARHAKAVRGSKSLLTRAAKLSRPTDSQAGSAGQRPEPIRYFRGVKIETPESAKTLPYAGVREGVVGPNRQPVRVLNSDAK